jgi:hypothetical protein
VLPTLTHDALHIAVFGPGLGELIAVRAPPGHWLVIDGCGPPARSYGRRLLEHYGTSASLIAFTHPHVDHTSGLLEVIDVATRGPQASWPGIGVLSPSPRGPSPLGAIAPHFGGMVEDTLATIDDLWERAPSCRWDLRVGTSRALGDAEVRVISPATTEATSAYDAWRHGRRWNPNRVATAFELRWRGHRIMLGSDLDEDDGGGWSAVALADRTRPPHAVTKVPHHGSVRAVHPVWIDPRGHLPCFIVTPFSRERLPRFDDGDGVHQMLGLAEQVHLTGLPRRHAIQSASQPLVDRRAALHVLGEQPLDPVTPGWPDCFVIASVSPSGTTALTHGPGSVVVFEG